MLPSSRSRLVRLLGAGLVAGLLITAAPNPVHAAPHPVVALAAAEASYEQKLAAALKFTTGDQASALAEKTDYAFVVALWNLVKNNSDHLEVRAAAEQAFSADQESDAAFNFIVTGVDIAFKADAEREKAELAAKEASDKARATAAASIDVVADDALLNGSDADFVRLIWERVADDKDDDGKERWPKVKAAARAAREGSDEDRRVFIATGMAAAAKQDADDRIVADDRKTEAQKAAERAIVAKRSAANRVGLPVTDILLALPDRDFVIEIWNHTPNGSEVQAAAIAAARSSDPAVWKGYIDTGIHQAKDRDIQIALDKLYEADKVAAEKIRTTATAAGDVNLAYWAGKALAAKDPAKLADFLRAGQFDLDVRTGFESAEVRPGAITPVTNGVVNVAGQALGVGTIDYAHAGTAALAYAGTDQNTQSSYAYLKLLNVTRVAVKADTKLSYWIFPRSRDQEIGSKTRNATCVSVDVIFNDGSRLRDTQLKDQRGTRIHPQSQCSKLIADEWNQVVVPLGSLAGKQVSTIVVGYDQPANGGAYRGYLDDLTITDEPVEITDPGNPRESYPVDNYRNDFNNDGASDIFTRNATTDVLRLHRGNGRGDWWIEPSKTVQIGAGWGQFDFVFAMPDFNGDKNVDVIGHNAAGELKFYPGNGKGGWIGTTATTLSLKLPGITGIFSPGDFDGDGFTDLIVRGQTPAPPKLLLYRGNGKGGFLNASSPKELAANWRTYTTTFSPGDFDGDGFSDIITLSGLLGLQLHRGDGKGGFKGEPTRIDPKTAWADYTSITSPGDFTGDGLADLVVRTSTGDLVVHPGDGHGSVSTASINRYKIGAGWNIFDLIF